MWETNFTETTLLLKIQSFEEQAFKFIRKGYSRELWHTKKLYDLWKFMRPYIIRINGGLVLLYFPSSSGLEWKEWIREIVWPWEGEDACSRGASAGSKINGSLLFQETWRSICGWSYLTRESIDQSAMKVPPMKKTAWWLSLLWMYHIIR